MNLGESIRHVWVIAKRELVGYYTSPVAYVFALIADLRDCVAA